MGKERKKMMGWIVMGTLASLVGAVCSLLCLRRLRRESAPEERAAVQAEDDEGDGELREGILNLMRYAPAGKSREEE